MDDISLIGSFDLLELVAQEIADSYENIGLHLNASKCLLIGSSAQDLVINDSIVPFTNYSSDAFKFLGCWLGNVHQIQNELQVILEKMKIELDSISSLDIEKHIKFFMLKICYTGRITHILRSCAPSIALDFCRSFNSLRTEFFADLLDVEPGMLKSHLFSSANLGGIGFTKSSILCQSAFLGGGKNFIYEFSRRFPDDSHLLVPNCSPYLYELSCELEKLPPQIWTKCFPQSIQEIPNRSLFNLQFCCKKLQQKLSKIFESLDFDVRLGLAKKKNPAFANLLQDMCDSTSSALVTTIPQVYGTLLSNSAWTLNMRFRSFIWPDNLPHNLICKCSREITTTHLLNCKHFITFRSKVHDAVRDQLYCMCKSHRIESFLEPLLSNLFDAEIDFHKNNRGDVILPGLDGSFILLDVMSVDPCNASNERLVNSEIHNPLSNAENFKFKKYNEPLSKLASLQHAKYNLYPFVFSLFGSLAPTALRPSGISFDLLKIACSSAPEIADDLAHYFQQLIVLKINPPFELLLVPNCSPYLYELSCELEKLPPQIWTKCFPQSIQEIPNRSLFNLQFCCKKLQQKLSKIFESLDFDVRLGLAKKKNPAFANLLQDMCDSTSSALVTTIPQVYGTLLSDSAWTLNMRFRSFIWPDNLPHNLICKCSREITTTHLLNCKHFITFRSKVHDAVRDQLYCMCKSHRIESFLEPLLSNLFDAENDFHKNNRGDVILPGLDGSFILLDVMSVDPCNASNERLVNSEIHNPLSNAENFKFKNTMNLCPNWPVYSMQNTISRLIALVKPGNGIKPDGIRPIAVGESLSRLLASIVFDRVKDKASTFLNPHQFGIKTIDGASVAAIASDTFFNAEENNFIFNLDFKNAFNSVKREAIFEVIKSDFPELSSFFYHFYGKESDLIFNSFGLKSSSGVKQGDPLGPLLFCLAIHKTLNIIKQKYPSIKIVAYMDDTSLIGSFDLLELVAQEIADSYENIGLHLNASKCLLIGSSAQDLVINDSIVPFTNYSSDAFKFLGCWLGNVPQIQNELQVILKKMKIELDSISSLDIEKHIKFFMLKICYTGRITHILRSCAPSIALDFCRSFNSLRTEFLLIYWM
ncbi:hypothetical protein P9112_014461 [Eukaryota sp. TZLM1-RC]